MICSIYGIFNITLKAGELEDDIWESLCALDQVIKQIVQLEVLKSMYYGKWICVHYTMCLMFIWLI